MANHDQHRRDENDRWTDRLIEGEAQAALNRKEWERRAAVAECLGNHSLAANLMEQARSASP